ncbi:NAD(P)-dependent oxidoreductase [Enterococcus larvae]|uniref:NAD(P)-dependent oxidoreductase n=1 Tax=Enterococcus larvae TaxID=2794352 RepID=UPI003F375281
MNILVTRRLLEKDIDYIKNGIQRQTDKKFQLIELEEYTEESILNRCEEADILLGPFVTENIVEKANRLKLIQIPWTGLDTFDFKAVQGFTGTVCNSHSNATPVAEFGVSLVMSLIKKISFHDQLMKAGNWNRDEKLLSLKSMSLSGAKIGIMGYGAIGSRMGKIMKAFGSDIYILDNGSRSYPEVTKKYSSAELLDFCNQVDIIICCLPLTEETKKLFDDKLFSEITNSPYIVNISRAEIFDQKAMYSALKNNIISGYASDVWWQSSEEALDFTEFSNVVMSPHRAGFVEGTLPHLEDAVTNLVNFMNGAELINIVDVDKQY